MYVRFVTVLTSTENNLDDNDNCVFACILQLATHMIKSSYDGQEPKEITIMKKVLL